MNDLTEKEQLEELRTWWRENRAMVLTGIALGIAAIVGFRMYTADQERAALEASAQYEALVEEVADDDLDGARPIAEALFADYDGTVYARQARLAMARLYMDRGRDADAADVLRPLATPGSDEPLALVARLRLARILLYQDQPQAALDLIGTPGDSAFAARYNEVVGDAHYALGNFDAAATAWNAVLADTLGQQTVDVQLVRMKLDDLPEPGDATATPATAGEDDAAADEATE